MLIADWLTLRRAFVAHIESHRNHERRSRRTGHGQGDVTAANLRRDALWIHRYHHLILIAECAAIGWRGFQEPGATGGVHRHLIIQRRAAAGDRNRLVGWRGLTHLVIEVQRLQAANENWVAADG